MHPDYITVVVGNNTNVTAYKLSFREAVFTVGLTASFPFAIRYKSKSLACLIGAGFAYITRRVMVIKA